jgi:hypothetical protein
MLPKGVQLIDPNFPDANVLNSVIALKLNYEGVTLDGSLSYFNGYVPMPGLSAIVVENLIQIFPTAYRAQIMGADFSGTIGCYGLRGEFAYKKSEKEKNKWASIPHSQIEFVFGLDRELGNFSFIVQYIGKYVFDFTKLKKPDLTSPDFINHQIRLWNRMLTSQLEQWSHSISVRPAWKLYHETLDVELLGMFNFSTEEVFLKPKIGYDLTDDLTLTIGAQLYFGPNETLYGEIDESISAGFLEFKAYF